MRPVRRSLCHHLPSSAGITLVLALGIWLSIVVFSVLNSVVLQSLPYPDASQIVAIYSENLEEGRTLEELTALEVTEALIDVPGFDSTAFYGWGAFTFSGSGPARLIETSLVSADYFSVFGLQAALGRTLNANDVDEERSVAVLNYPAWIELTGGAEDAIGQILSFQGSQFELVGVMPDSFTHPTEAPHMYVPMPAVVVSADIPGYADARLFSAIGRIGDSVSESQAVNGLRIRHTAVSADYGAGLEGWRLQQSPILDELLGNTRNILPALFVLAICVLLVACSAAASLAAVRMDSRVKEFAVRRTLGATNSRIALSLLAELLILVTLAYLIALVFVDFALRMLALILEGVLPRSGDIGLDGASLLFALIISVATALLTCVAPLKRALRTSTSQELRVSHNTEVLGRGRNMLVPVVGIGLSTVALASALAFSMSLVRLGDIDLGFRAENIAAVQVFRPRPDVSQFVEAAFDELRAVPGVRNVSAVRSPPLDTGARFSMTVAAGRAIQDTTTADVQRAAPGYHAFLGIPILRGREFSEVDDADAARVAIINQTLATRLFGTDEPVGRQMVVFSDDAPVPFEIVGLARDSRNTGLRAPSSPEIVVPIAQFPQWPYSITLLADSALPPTELIPELEGAIYRADPEQPIYRSFTLSEEVASQTKQSRLFSQLTSSFAVLAILLGSFGLYAVVSSMVAQGKRAIGLRMALGATPRNASKLILATTVRVVGYGASIGLVLSIPVLKSFESELFAIDPLSYLAIFGVTTLLLIFTGLLASSVSAWRASRIQPMEALRSE